MQTKKIPIYKRAIAYFIDLMIVAILSSLLSLVFTNAEKNSVNSQKLVDLTNQVVEKKITTEEYYKEFDAINYEVTLEGIPTTVITCVVIVIYYVVLSYFCHGITLGKYLMKLKIVSAKDKELSIGNYLLRCLIVNLLLTNLSSVILVKLLTKASYISVYPKVSNAFTLLLLVSMIMLMYREDGRGLHDFMAGTKIVRMNEEMEINKENVQEEVNEAKVLEEKIDVVTEKKETKKTKTKKKTNKTGGKK